MQQETMSETGEVDRERVPHGIIYGELHVYKADITKNPNWKEIKEAARDADTVILEHPTDPAHNCWTSVASYTYMRAAELNAKLRKKKIVYLDPTVGVPISEKVRIYQEQGLDLNERAIVLIEALKLSIFIAPDNEWVENMLTMVRNISENLDPPVQDKIVASILDIYASTDRSQFIESILTFDAEVRERAFQDNLAQILDDLGTDERFVIVVGHEHFQGIVRTCKEPDFRTEISDHSNILQLLKNI